MATGAFAPNFPAMFVSSKKTTHPCESVRDFSKNVQCSLPTKDMKLQTIDRCASAVLDTYLEYSVLQSMSIVTVADIRHAIQCYFGHNRRVS